jgi:hypothetical protein
MDAGTFEPMSIGQILDRTFKLYKDNFIRFIAIVAVIQVPIAILNFLSTSAVRGGMETRPATGGYAHLREQIERDSQNMSAEEIDAKLAELREGRQQVGPIRIVGLVGTAVTVLLALFGVTLMQGVLTKSVSEAYLGNEIAVGEAYRFAWPKLVTLVGAAILVALTGLGYLFCLVPGVIFSVWFSMTTPAIITEDLKAVQGMSRSKALAKGNLGKVLSVLFLVVLLGIVIVIPFMLVGWFAANHLKENYVLAVFANQLLQTVGQVIAAPLRVTALILLYYDLRIRKEGFDLEMLARSMRSEQGEEYVQQQY